MVKTVSFLKMLALERVSTLRQEKSGPMLEAQRKAVENDATTIGAQMFGGSQRSKADDGTTAPNPTRC